MNVPLVDALEAGQEFPDAVAQRRLQKLVGLDDHQSRLQKGLSLILDRTAAETWSKRHYGRRLAIIDEFRHRPPLFLLSGDVGTGKTALAETIGDAVARAEKIRVTLYRMSLASRGSGLVGEMTRLIAMAFATVSEAAKKLKESQGKSRGGCILLIDEADALAQSREAAQMHHEDRAGVNALIRGISDLGVHEFPAAVIMCTNRPSAIDPAVRRRAADVILFSRPNPEQRREILYRGLTDAGFTNAQIDQLVDATGPEHDLPGFTYSDLTERFLCNLMLDAYPDQPLHFERALQLAKEMAPAPVFRDEASG